ncbi:MAG TPA: DUF1015 family protein [Nocardioides sp.]|nr:DUF1015 family protein [Nocardioides sp.]
MDSGSVVIPPYVAGPLRLEPFRGLMLSPARIGDPASARAFARPYKDVAARLARWERQGHIIRDAEAALYLHEYTAGGITVRGLVGALDVSQRAAKPDARAILPHEGIYPAQADDLADRMAQMQLNPAPILLVHRASPRLRALLAEIAMTPPDREFTDRAEQRHRVWALRGRPTLEVIATELAPSRALIADGHHRYAAYLRLQRREPGGPSDQGLAMLVDQDDTPLFLGAIHRLLLGTTMDDVRSAADTAGMDYSEHSEEGAVAVLGPDHMVVTDSKRWAVVRLPVTSDHAAVELLHDNLIPALPHGPRRIGYHHTVEDTLAQVTPGIGVAVLLPAPEVDLVLRIAGDDRLLPEKATSFQPKPSLGVLIRSLRDG